MCQGHGSLMFQIMFWFPLIFMTNSNTKWFRCRSICLCVIWFSTFLWVFTGECINEKKILPTCLRSGDGKIPSCPPYAITIEGTGMQAVRQYWFFEMSYLVIYLMTAKGTREKEWVVLCPTDGVSLPSVYLIGGQPNTGKTFLELYRSTDLFRELPWFPLQTGNR